MSPGDRRDGEAGADGGGGPPAVHRVLLHLFVPRGDLAHVESELEELRRLRVETRGRGAANRWYRRQVWGFALRGARAGSGRGAARRRRDGPGALDALSVDVRLAWRRLVARPATTAVALVVLVLGIGSGTAVFSVVDGVVLSPLPYPEADRLVQVRLRETGNRQPVAPPAYLLWNAEPRRTVEGVAATTFGGADLVVGGEPMHVRTAPVGHELFDVLGVAPVLGRAFTAEEDALGVARVAILSHALWTGRFGGDARLVGRTVRLDGEPHTVVGVLPATFDFPAGTDVWIPLRPSLAGMEDVWGVLFLHAVARLRPGASPASAAAELDAAMAGTPEAERFDVAIDPLREEMVGDVRRPLLLLLGAVVLVLLAACANVGGLLLTRAVGRRRELAVRAALGAGRGRLVGGLLLESLLLAGLAGILGVALAAGALDTLLALAPGDLPRGSEIGLDGRVLSFAVGATLLTGLVAGVLPALRVRSDMATTLREGEAHTGDRAAGRARSLLVAGQVAVTVVLLSGAGLLGRSFLGLVSEDMGFDPEGLAAVELDLPEHLYPDEARLGAAYRELQEAAARIPGVEGAAVTRNLPLAGRRLGGPVWRADDPDASVLTTHVSATPGYLELVGARVLAGRTFTSADIAEGRRAAVVSEAFARALFGGDDAVGRTVVTAFGREEMEIVGVVADVRHASPAAEPPPLLYRPLRHWTSRGVHVVVRSALPPPVVLPALREAVREVRRDQAVVELVTVEALLSRTVARPRFYALLLGSFAAVALLLSTLGFHGLLSSFVLQHRREIGIRMAMGADAGRVRRMVVGRGLALTSAGLVAGVAGALALHRLLEGLLFRVSGTDGPTLAAVAALTLLTALAAAWPIARRATRTDPVEVMRA